MNEKWPFNKQTIATPGSLGNSGINPMPSVPGEQFMRSIDPPAGDGGGTGPGATTGDWPFKLVAVDTENVKVLQGTVNGFTPTGINTSIDVSGTDGTWSVYLDATVDASTGAVTAVDVSSSSAGTVPSDSSTHSYRLVGYVTVASSVIDGDPQPSMAWSQNFTACTPGDPDTYHWTTGA